jgi:hypothetical protein
MAADDHAYEAELRRQALEIERIRVALESADKLELERIKNATVVPGAWTAEQIKEYVERILTEREKAVVREQEARNAAVLREQETRDVALRREQEARDTALIREQASRDLAVHRERENLAAMIAQGDTNLREHMAQQIEGVRQQGGQQIEGVRQQIAAATRESEIRAGEGEKAILKQEAATEARFASVNEWRGQSLDRERSQQEQTSKLSSTFAPREVVDAKVDDLSKRIEANTRRIDQSGGQKEGAAEATTARQMSNGAIVGIISALVGGAGLITAVIIAATALTGG